VRKEGSECIRWFGVLDSAYLQPFRDHSDDDPVLVGKRKTAPYRENAHVAHITNNEKRQAFERSTKMNVEEREGAFEDQLNHN
jgi:hypothetical protein